MSGYNELFQQLKEYCTQQDGGLQADNPEQLLEELMKIVQEHMQQRDNDIYQEIKSIGQKINQTREEITKPISENAVSDAKTELSAVVKSTEEATETILDTVEHIQTVIAENSDKALAEQIQNDIGVIFEACNFQDLTGQRIAKVTATLEFIEDVVGSLLKTLAKNLSDGQEMSESDSLKNGPQLEEKAPTQDDIDKLFDEA